MGPPVAAEQDQATAATLLQLGVPAGVLETFREELALHGEVPAYRIGIWRVLAEASSQEESQQWLERIRKVFLNEAAADRVHAVESLAKLNYEIEQSESACFEEASQSEDPGLANFALWALAASPQQTASSEPQCREALTRSFASEESIDRLRVAIALSRLPELSTCQRAKLYATA